MKLRSRRAAAHLRCLVFIGSLIAVVLVGCSSAGGKLQTGAAPGTPPNLRKLAWSPPQCGDQTHRCKSLYLRNTGSHQTPVLNNNTDYQIHLPKNGPLVGGITIAGGRRVEIIGGEIDLTYPCSNDASHCTGIYIAKKSPGSMFVEGVWIHNPARIGPTCPTGASKAAQTCSTGHGIDINTADDGQINVNTITLENIRIDGISGCSGYGDHADVIQPYQAPDDTIQIDGLTGVTNCTGLMLDPDLAYDNWHTFPTSITITNTNIDVTANPYPKTVYPTTWWLTYANTCESGPVFLSDDYSSEPLIERGSPSMWPNPDNPDCGTEDSNGIVSWKNTRIEGSIQTGNPPEGDFVPLGVAGLDYRLAGYGELDPTILDTTVPPLADSACPTAVVTRAGRRPCRRSRGPPS